MAPALTRNSQLNVKSSSSSIIQNLANNFASILALQNLPNKPRGDGENSYENISISNSSSSSDNDEEHKILDQH
jgi:hypothetical protein